MKSKKQLQVRDRIKSLRRVKASELQPNPHNWRTHPESQQNALRGILDEVGYADVLLARELPDKSLELIDGHLRAEITPDQKVPVLVLDLDEEEADKLLAVLDPLAALAMADQDALGKLLTDVKTDNEELGEMLKGLADEYGIGDWNPPLDADGKEYDESVADDVEMMECPECGHKFPK